MAHARTSYIQHVEVMRNSKVITYITGDRPNLSSRIAPDAIRVFYRHLESIGRTERIDLLLYTRGGDVLTPLRLIHLIREYADEVNILIPYRAYSAGTLFCLGADEIVMGKMGELGPIDPSVSNFFNPSDPTNPEAKIPISVEDVFAFLNLACSCCKTEDDLINNTNSAFEKLISEVHPLALGNVHRNHTLIRSMAKKLFDSRTKNIIEEEMEKKIIDQLTEKFYSHSYMISRQEAKEIGLPIVYPGEELDHILWNLYMMYEKELRLMEPFIAADYIRTGEKSVTFDAIAGFVESLHLSDIFEFRGIIEETFIKEVPKLSINILKQRWIPLPGEGQVQ